MPHSLPADAAVDAAADAAADAATDMAASRPNLEFRLALKQDLDELTEVTEAAATVDDKCNLGLQLLHTPDIYHERLPKLMRTFTRNNCYTCVVAEATDEKGAKSIVGYAVWGWVEYDRYANNGNGVVKGGILPRVRDIWDKYLPDCERPTDPPRVKHGNANATPKHETEILTWQTDEFSESWNVHFLHAHPGYDRRYLEEALISWACNIADQEQIWLRVTWPLDTIDSFWRAGFLDECVYFSELNDQNGKLQLLPTMKLRRRPAQTPKTSESSSSSSGGGGYEDLLIGLSPELRPN